MTVETDGLSHAAGFQLTVLNIVSASGAVVDLRGVIRELNLYEDLFGNTMTGSALVNDTQNLINLLPIVGSEYLTVVLNKPSSQFQLSKVFRIYKLSDRTRSTTTSEDYVLHFCSEELILSESIKISKSYKGMSVSEMVKDIATNYLGIASWKFPDSAITSTVGNFDIVVPMWSPLYTINWLSRMARAGSSPSCSFVFFEDGAGYHFTSIELLSQQEPLQPINFMPLSLAGESAEQSQKSDTQMKLESAENYRLVNAPDTLRNISVGAYAGKLMRVNILDQRIKTMTVDGIKLFDTTKHTNRNTFLQPAEDRTQLPQNKHHDAFYRVAADTLGVENWMLQRNAYMASLHGFQVKVVLPGNMMLRVGQVVQLNFPASVVNRAADKQMDKLFTGKYLITAIRHKIDRTNYACILELSKDSLEQPLVGPLNSNPAINTIRRS